MTTASELVCGGCGYRQAEPGGFTAGSPLCPTCGSLMTPPRVSLKPVVTGAAAAPATPSAPAPADAAGGGASRDAAAVLRPVQDGRDLIACAHCEGLLHRRAPGCPHCGAPRPSALPPVAPPPPDLGRIACGALGALLLVLALASVLRMQTFLGPFAPLNAMRGVVPLVLGLGAIALAATLAQRFALLWLSGCGSVVVVAVVFANFQLHVEAARAAARAATGEAAMQVAAGLGIDAIGLEWGCGVMLLAAWLQLWAAWRRSPA